MKYLFEAWRAYLSENIDPKTIEKIEHAIVAAGGEPYIVGGAVRDELIPGTPASKDVDFLIRKLPLPEIAAVLAPLGKVVEVGKSFGVVTATIDGEDFDFAIPRTKEEKTGEKHTDFTVQTDPNAPLEADLGRRDLTINALAKDANGRIVDLFGGVKDIQNRTIRAVGNPKDRFREDPLRMMRAIQFAARFGFNIEPKTAAAIKNLRNELKTVSPERILMELQKAWTKGLANSKILVKLLEQLGIGQMLFGDDFQPYILPGSPDEVVQFVAFFLRGGDYKKIKPTNEMTTTLQLARNVLAADDIWQYVGPNKDKLPLILDILSKTGNSERARWLADIMQKPILPKELDISGNELIQMGLKGAQIGQTMKAILAAIHQDKIDNEHEQILDFLNAKAV